MAEQEVRFEVEVVPYVDWQLTHYRLRCLHWTVQEGVAASGLAETSFRGDVHDGPVVLRMAAALGWLPITWERDGCRSCDATRALARLQQTLDALLWGAPHQEREDNA